MKKIALLLLIGTLCLGYLVQAWAAQPAAVPTPTRQTTADDERALAGPSGVAVAPNDHMYAALYPISRV